MTQILSRLVPTVGYLYGSNLYFKPEGKITWAKLESNQPQLYPLRHCISGAVLETMITENSDVTHNSRTKIDSTSFGAKNLTKWRNFFTGHRRAKT